jgi:hypothetical protein
VVEVFDTSRSPVGPVEMATGTLVARYNGVGTFSLKMARRSIPSAVWDVLDAPGGSIRVTDADRPLADPIMSGLVQSTLLEWGEQNPWDGMLTVTGVTWEQVLAERVVYPYPETAWPSIPTKTKYRSPTTGTAAAETVALDFVNKNAGPGALAARRVPGLAMSTDGARGTSLAIGTAYEPVLDVVQRACSVGGIGFRIDQQADGSLLLVFSTPTTRTGVILSVDSGAVRSGSHSVTAPTSTRALVCGTVVTAEIADTAAETTWGRRIETYVEATSTDDSDELKQAGDEAVIAGVAVHELKVDVVDTPQAVYGVDYRLGDRIGYENRVIGEGVISTDVVREVEITIDADATRVTQVVGTEGAMASPKLYRRVGSMHKAMKGIVVSQSM